jgi:predicted cupin superfamily sugar epimerase
MKAEEIIRLLHLKPLPVEGGYYAETYRSDVIIEPPSLPGRYTRRGKSANGGADPTGRSTRAAGTAIYYLLTPDTFSALHRLASDEVYHFYLGDPVEMLLLRPDGSGAVITLGPDIAAGMHVQFTVPGGVWQGSRLRAGGPPKGGVASEFALLGTTMSPGFDPADFELGRRDELVRAFPAHAEKIRLLTR